MAAPHTFHLALERNIPLVAWGPPGIVNTAIIHQEAKRRGWPIETVLASIRQPDDFAGLPYITEKGVVMIPPDWGKRLAEVETGILFLDEVSCTAPATQAALLRVVLERVVGDLKLPPGVRILAAANPPEQAAGGWELALPLANRLVHVDWPPPSIAEWTAWSITKQASLDPHGASLISAFLSRRPELLLQVPNNETEGSKAWPSPRSWAMAAQLLGNEVLSPGEAASVVGGCVGQAASTEFLAWRESAGILPDPEELLANPKSWKPPTDRIDVIYATLHSVVAVTAANLTPARWNAAWSVLEVGKSVASDAVIASGSTLAKARNGRKELKAPTWIIGVAESIDEIRSEV